MKGRRLLTWYLVVACFSLVEVGSSQELTELADPCLKYKCEGGSECVAVVNDLLQLPVAHCVPGQPEDGEAAGCSSREVGVSVVSCKTLDQWLNMATTSCTGSRAASVQVRHPCHRRGSQSPSIFLQATISCCQREETPPPTTEATPTVATYEDVSPSPRDQEVQAGDSQEYGAVTAVILTVGTTLVILLVTMAAIKFVCRRRRSTPYKPRLSFVTSYVNPSSEGWQEGEGEKTLEFSYVVANSNCD